MKFDKKNPPTHVEMWMYVRVSDYGHVYITFDEQPCTTKSEGSKAYLVKVPVPPSAFDMPKPVVVEEPIEVLRGPVSHKVVEVKAGEDR